MRSWRASLAMEVAAIESIESLRAGEPLPGCYEAVADTAFRRTFSSTALATSQRAVGASSGPDGLCAQLGEGARLAMCGEDEHTLSRFLVLFRRRRIAAIVVGMSRWPGELLSSPGHVRAVAAPPPADVYWPNLLRPRWRLRVNRAIAVTLTSILFLFWTVPVGAVQALALGSTARIPALRWLAKTIQRFGPAATATLEGYLSATVLQAALWLTPSSGLFRVPRPAARLRLKPSGGARRGTDLSLPASARPPRLEHRLVAVLFDARADR